jgi:hypothetical protein
MIVYFFILIIIIIYFLLISVTLVVIHFNNRNKSVGGLESLKKLLCHSKQWGLLLTLIQHKLLQNTLAVAKNAKPTT